MKKILFFAALVFAVMQVTAANVDLATAQQSAQRFLMSQTAKGRFMTSTPTIKWTHEVKNSNDITLAAYYIVNTDKGYVIVSGDDRGREILAYGDGELKSMNDLPESMQFFLDMYQAEVEYLQAHPGQVVKTRNTSRGVAVEPMLTTVWNQGTSDGRSPYNKFCPVVNGTYCKVGCAAVSLAQVMNFWEYPEGSPALPGYTGPAFGVTVSDLPPITFDWANMRDYYKNNNWSEAERDAIANLMRYVGQAEKMDYGTQMSGADEDQMMEAIRLFGYDSGVHYMLKNDYDSAMTELVNDEEWIATMQAELVAGRPLMYCAGASMSDGSAFYGHAFNVDGYNADDDMYHVNFGQSEEHNGYYAFNAFGYGISIYKYFQLMFVGMQPPTGSVPPRVLVNPQYLSMEAYAGESTTATFNVVGLDLTGDVTLAVTDENNYFSTDVTTIAMDEAGNKEVTVTYAPTTIGEHEAYITISTPGAQDVILPLYGSASEAPLVLFDPVMQPVNEEAITLTSFRADWTDQTPAQNVTSYTLEVKTKPNYSVLADADWSNTEEVFTNQAGSWAASGLIPEGWSFSGYGLWAEDKFMSFKDAVITLPEFTGYDKVTVVFTGRGAYGSANVTVATSQASQAYALANGVVEQYVVVLNCAETDRVTFTATSGYVGLLNVTVYSGEVEPPTAMRASETGDDTYRLITGITDKSYTVNNLTAGGTFLYKVKAVYIDGTESAWSNTEEVTLFENEPVHDYELGDVNHDGDLTIADVTILISYVLKNGVGTACPICADVNNDGFYTIADVTMLISKVLKN